MAVLCGADGFVAIETYGQANQAWLETFLDLPYGIPSHDTLGRVFGMLEAQELHRLSINLLKRESSRLSLKMNERGAGVSPAYPIELLKRYKGCDEQEFSAANSGS